MTVKFIPPHGGYEDLLSFRKARIVYDGTARFCERFVGKDIIEGSQASRTSKETEIKLINVASRASLEELLEDYRDFLSVRGSSLWEKESREARFVRQLGTTEKISYDTHREFIETRPAATVASIMIRLIPPD